MERELQWLLQRGLNEKTIREAGLTWANGKIKIPYRINGKEVGYQVRLIDKKEFYFNEGFQPTLYLPTGFYPRGYEVWVSEGAMDALILHQNGFPAVAIPSASTYHTVSDLPFRNVYLALDNDEPGELACKKIAALGLPFKLFRVKYQGKDPNECILANGGKFSHEIVPYIPGGVKHIKEFSLNGNVTHRELLTFNNELPSWNKGDLVVLYGGKGSGKTSWLLSMLSKYNRMPVLFEEYELTPEMLITWYKLVGGAIDHNIYLPTEYLDPTGTELMARITSSINCLGVKIIVIDTLHYHSSSSHNPVNVITSMSQKLKLIAMKYGLVIIVLMHETGGNIRDCHLIGSADHILYLKRLDNGIIIEGQHRFSPKGTYAFNIPTLENTNEALQ